jgi:hypothetical protein
MALVSTLFAAPEHWEAPVLDYVGFQAAAPWDGTGGHTRHVNRAVLCGASLRSPIVVAFVLPGDEAIYIGHSPSEYTPDPLQASPLDNSLVVLVGNDLTSVTPMSLHNAGLPTRDPCKRHSKLRGPTSPKGLRSAPFLSPDRSDQRCEWTPVHTAVLRPHIGRSTCLC